MSNNVISLSNYPINMRGLEGLLEGARYFIKGIVKEVVEEVKKDEDVKAEEEKEEIDLQKIKDEAKEEAKKEMEELIKAKEEVEDVAGKCAVQDSAAKYYKIGLEAMGISCKGVMDEDLRGMFRGAVAKSTKSVVMDGAAKQDAINEALGKCNLPKRVY